MQTNTALTGPPVSSIAEFVDRMAEIAAVLPATDGLAGFNHMYQLVTTAVGEQVGTGGFQDQAWMSTLDVVFSNLYLSAVRASSVAPDQVSRAWAPLLVERRFDTRVTPLQFALAGMNAHINHDLPIAVVDTCAQLHTAPDAGPHHADFERVNAILARVEPAIRTSFSDALMRAADLALPGLQDVVANFDMVKARETAWANAMTLWSLRQVSAPVAADYLNGLDHLVGFAGRGLLAPLRPQ